jgi:Ca2+-binding EF-hand superfamily protein
LSGLSFLFSFFLSFSLSLSLSPLPSSLDFVVPYIQHPLHPITRISFSAIKAIVLLNNLRMQFGDMKKEMENVLETGEIGSITTEQRREIEATFDMFDTDGGGEIDSREFREVMSSLGVNVTEEEAAEKLKVLDKDNNGSISKEEFVAWHIVNMKLAEEHKESSVEELVDQLFDLFDTDNGTGGAKDGVITVAEFRDGLNRFDAGLSNEEVCVCERKKERAKKS